MEELESSGYEERSDNITEVESQAKNSKKHQKQSVKKHGETKATEPIVEIGAKARADMHNHSSHSPHSSDEDKYSSNSSSDSDEHFPHHHINSDTTLKHENNTGVSKSIIALMVVATLLVLFNQVQINSISGMMSSGLTTSYKSSSTSLLSGSGDLGSVNIDELQSTAQTVAAVFPELNGASSEDIVGIMFPTGVPEYGEDLGVSFDDPVSSLATLAKMYPSLKSEVEKSNPDAFKRYINLASKPKGVSCEYCCGVGPIGADSNGNSRCGCQHNPAVLSLTLYLSAYSDYTDAEILREVMKWKTLFFPKNMIELGSSIAGGDTAVLENLPGMVGGC